jgi:hypothetical protein
VTAHTFTPDVVACLDIGSPKKGNVGWAILYSDERATGGDLHGFINELAGHLAADRTVAVGFECPLYVPMRLDPAAMTDCRVGEQGLNWCGGPGASVLATGLVQVNWCLARLAERDPGIRGTTRWAELSRGSADVYCWEAFITSKGGVVVELNDVNQIPHHEQDALCGAVAFARAIADHGAPRSDLGDEAALSLVGLHLLQTGMTTDVTLLSETCTVLKVRKPK